MSVSTFGSIAVLLYIWIEKFSLTTEVAIWAPAVLQGSLFLTGPLTSLIIEVIGIWKTHALAGVILCVGAVATAFATQFWHVVISYSLLQGFAGGTLQIASIGIVSTYFDKLKDKVYAGVIAAGYVGVLIAPVLTEYLIDTTSYRVAILIGAAAYVLNRTPSPDNGCKEFLSHKKVPEADSLLDISQTKQCTDSEDVGMSPKSEQHEQKEADIDIKLEQGAEKTDRLGSKSSAGMFAISVVFGLTDGMFVSGMSSLIQYQFGHNEQFLTRFSYLMLMAGVGSVIGPIGAGHLGTVIGMKNSFYFLGGVAICGPIASGIYVVCVRVRGH
ncbi:monocarboxylate transporter 12-like [Watersipora subatra]|uniref:monocarboxylate transporter 12-like n=1 Tax=Watersipora subatra TaxID=2589382 RepID=UPI00355B65C6